MSFKEILSNYLGFIFLKISLQSAPVRHEPSRPAPIPKQPVQQPKAHSPPTPPEARYYLADTTRVSSSSGAMAPAASYVTSSDAAKYADDSDTEDTWHTVQHGMKNIRLGRKKVCSMSERLYYTKPL